MTGLELRTTVVTDVPTTYLPTYLPTYPPTHPPRHASASENSIFFYLFVYLLAFKRIKRGGGEGKSKLDFFEETEVSKIWIWKKKHFLCWKATTALSVITSSVTRCWGYKAAQMHPKVGAQIVATAVLHKLIFYKTAQTPPFFLGYICKQIWWQELVTLITP